MFDRFRFVMQGFWSILSGQVSQVPQINTSRSPGRGTDSHVQLRADIRCDCYDFHTQMQLSRAFHLFASLHHAYTWIRLMLVQYKETDNEYMLMMRHEPFRYLTIWNLILQSMYFSGCGLDVVLRNNMPLRSVWKQARETMFQAVIFPMGLVVSTVFWTIYLYDRSLVYPEIVDEILPPHLNHLMHTSIGVFVLLEILLRPHYYSKENSNVSILMVLSTCYCILFHWTYISSGKWIYPLYYHLTWPQRMCMSSLVAYIAPYVYYVLGEKTARSFWGRESQPEMNGKKR